MMTGIKGLVVSPTEPHVVTGLMDELQSDKLSPEETINRIRLLYKQQPTKEKEAGLNLECLKYMANSFVRAKDDEFQFCWLGLSAYTGGEPGSEPDFLEVSRETVLLSECKNSSGKYFVSQSVKKPKAGHYIFGAVKESDLGILYLARKGCSSLVLGRQITEFPFDECGIIKQEYTILLLKLIHDNIVRFHVPISLPKLSELGKPFIGLFRSQTIGSTSKHNQSSIGVTKQSGITPNLSERYIHPRQVKNDSQSRTYEFPYDESERTTSNSAIGEETERTVLDYPATSYPRNNNAFSHGLPENGSVTVSRTHSLSKRAFMTTMKLTLCINCYILEISDMWLRMRRISKAEDVMWTPSVAFRRWGHWSSPSRLQEFICRHRNRCRKVVLD